jgi:hypothetical protein
MNKYDISLCNSCNCMTHTIKGKCGKCHASKEIEYEVTDDTQSDLYGDRGD